VTRLSAQSGVVAPLILIVLLVLLAGGYYLYTNGVVKLPKTPLTSNEPNVELTSEYKNPFDANSQYINPFSTYKNPFDTVK